MQPPTHTPSCWPMHKYAGSAQLYHISSLLLSRCSAVRPAYSTTSFVVLAMHACSMPSFHPLLLFAVVACCIPPTAADRWTAAMGLLQSQANNKIFIIVSWSELKLRGNSHVRLVLKTHAPTPLPLCSIFSNFRLQPPWFFVSTRVKK